MRDLGGVDNGSVCIGRQDQERDLSAALSEENHVRDQPVGLSGGAVVTDDPIADGEARQLRQGQLLDRDDPGVARCM